MANTIDPSRTSIVGLWANLVGISCRTGGLTYNCCMRATVSRRLLHCKQTASRPGRELASFSSKRDFRSVVCAKVALSMVARAS